MFQCSNVPIFQCVFLFLGSQEFLIHWSIGLLVHCSIGPLVHWSIGPLVHRSIGPLIHWLTLKCQMSNATCQMSKIKCQMSIRLTFCRSVPPEFLQSFLGLDLTFWQNYSVSLYKYLEHNLFYINCCIEIDHLMTWWIDKIENQRIDENEDQSIHSAQGHDLYKIPTKKKLAMPCKLGSKSVSFEKQVF